MKKDRVLFISDSCSELNGNLKFVYNEMLKRKLNFEYRFLLKQSIETRKSYKEILVLAYLIATSKFILLDDFYPMIYPLKIRKRSELIQLWHAVGAFKKFGYSRVGSQGGPLPNSKNHRNYTKVIVSSENVAQHYAEGFGIEIKNVLGTGIPRTDIFFDEDYRTSVINKFYSEYPYLRNKKVITFAPTFRGRGQSTAYYPMEMLNIKSLYNELKDDYILLVKFHPFIKEKIIIPNKYKDFCFDFTFYENINDLLFISDILITDYSSVCFEFALLNKPMLFFAFDLEEYIHNRGFYYDYQTFVPGPIVRNTDEVIKRILDRDFDYEKLESFIDYFFDHLDGKSSARVVDQIILEKKLD
ncbi:CDP-glycerol glycerophosphotransferase (TagB/SpsB family) [Pullulanibacillus pueri]|nr:CDP-glycerol glycerophosphotransferase (TagB/SpsB family) [Pullulanibacillus pueri]